MKLKYYKSECIEDPFEGEFGILTREGDDITKTKLIWRSDVANYRCNGEYMNQTNVKDWFDTEKMIVTEITKKQVEQEIMLEKL